MLSSTTNIIPHTPSNCRIYIIALIMYRKSWRTEVEVTPQTNYNVVIQIPLEFWMILCFIVLHVWMQEERLIPTRSFISALNGCVILFFPVS